LAIFFVLALSAWAGSAVAGRQKKVDPAKEEGLQIVLGATLTLFGLLIGFLLSFAISGYNARVSAEEDEAMALARACQRTQYLAARIAFYHEEDYGQRMALRMQSIELQTKMWNFVSAAAKQSPNQLTMSLVDACGELYISQQKTMASWHDQIPLAAWLILIVFGVCSNFLLGYTTRADGPGWLL